MRTFVLTCILLLALQGAGCALRMHEPGASREADLQEQPWRIHCETAKHALSDGAGPGAKHAGWVWARDTSGSDIVLDGYLEDGFLVVAAANFESSQGVPLTRATLRQLCERSVRQDDGSESPHVGNIRAARHHEEIDVPIVIANTATGKAPISRLVVFGDSLSDAGRLKRRMHIFPGDPYWLGRFSNGPVWTHYLQMSTYLEVQNHAYGGASVMHEGRLPGAGLIDSIKDGGQFFFSGSIELQIDDYIANYLAGGQLVGGQQTAFLIWAGANDYISKEPITGVITTFLNSPQGALGYKPVADRIVAALTRQVERLYRAGARHFALANLPDLGRTPIVLQNDTYMVGQGFDSDEARRVELSRRLTELTNYHNQNLARAAAQLHGTLPGASVVVVDTRGFIDNVMARRSLLDDSQVFDYGFDLDAMAQELTTGNQRIVLQKRCFTGMYIGSGGGDNICSAVHTAFFWDVVHPTTYAHCWQAWRVEQAFASAGWIERGAGPREHRDWCRRATLVPGNNAENMRNTASNGPPPPVATGLP